MIERDSTQIYQRQIVNALNNLFLRCLNEMIPQNILAKNYNSPLIKLEKRMEMEHIYSPKCDIAIGPFSFEEGNMVGLYNWIASFPEIAEFLQQLQGRCLGTGDNQQLNLNENPRCFMAIEVENSTARDVKHLLGSITNCAFLAKIGVVVIYDENLTYGERLLQYLAFVKRVKKADKNLFNNVFVIPKSSFDEIIGIGQ